MLSQRVGITQKQGPSDSTLLHDQFVVNRILQTKHDMLDVLDLTRAARSHAVHIRWSIIGDHISNAGNIALKEAARRRNKVLGINHTGGTNTGGLTIM